eukprot:CAMPEP_0197901690 /NCGR_PEP_ID=MMETSP1439-20131203/51638_1 /TAXON_ID=66791 /ORGANISM="Gonyaulax spinifera, Strain CCMP409" /LENGTH=42 /DNA_ID= /DNA_START= /DNA_END= /DNA_ORIENTATION=
MAVAQVLWILVTAQVNEFATDASVRPEKEPSRRPPVAPSLSY